MYIHCYPKARVNKSAVLGIQDFSLYEMSKRRGRNCGGRIEVNLIVGWATVTTAAKMTAWCRVRMSTVKAVILCAVHVLKSR
jgi:hypothetical protein